MFRLASNSSVRLFAADTLAWVYYRKGAYGLAIGLLEDAVKTLENQKQPPNATFHYHLGLAYMKSNDPVRARTHLQRALQIKPDYSQADDIRRALSELGG